jgi:hypothetical protein
VERALLQHKLLDVDDHKALKHFRDTDPAVKATLDLLLAEGELKSQSCCQLQHIALNIKLYLNACT